MFSFLPLRVLYFPCYVEVSLNSKLEPIFKKENPKIFKAYCVGWINCNLLLSTNVLFFDVHTNLIHRFVLLFSILSKTKILCQKGKNTQSSCMIFFVFYIGWAEAHYLSKWYQSEYKRT